MHLELAKLDLVTTAMAAIKGGASLPLPLRLRLTRTTTARLSAADIKPGMHVVCVEVPELVCDEVPELVCVDVNEVVCVDVPEVV